MKFFVPGSCAELDPEWIWSATREHLRDLAFPTTRRRIQALALGRGDDALLEVGGQTPDGEPVVVILEARDIDLYYVCTPFRGVLEGLPHILGLAPGSRVIDFDEEVVGWA